MTFTIDPNAATEGILAYHDNQGNVYSYTGPWVTGGVGGSYSSAQPFDIMGSGNKLAFMQQPSNAAAGDVIKPGVTVAVENLDGSTDTSTTDSVTLALTGSGASLAGTLTEPAVNGIATFSDLSIKDSGDYTLTASDGSDSPVTSSSFSITEGKLVFTVPPHTADAGAALDPAVKVALEDGKGKIDTADSSTVVTLTSIGVMSGSPITGNTATLSNGVATFSGLTLTQGGVYQLQAGDGADTTATSGKFKIGSDRLVFKGLPSSVDSGAKFDFKIVLENSKNQVVTDGDDAVQFTVGGPGFSSLTQAYTLDAGVAVVAGSQLFTPGAFTATAEDLTTVETQDASAKLTVKGDHLVFKGLPPSVDSGEKFSFKILLENSKNQVVTDDDDLLQFTVGGPGFSSLTQGYTLDKGVVVVTGSQLLTPGTFTATAEDLTNVDAADASAKLTVKGDHLVFKGLPSSVDSGDKLDFKILLENSKNQVVTDSDDSVLLTVGASGLSPLTQAYTLDAGVVVVAGSQLNTPGDFTVTAEDLTAAETADASAKLTVKADHLVFKGLPPSVRAGALFDFKILLENSENQVVTDGDDLLQLTVGGPGFSPLTGAYMLDAGVAVVAGSQVVTPGSYTVTAEDLTVVETEDASAKLTVKGAS